MAYAEGTPLPNHPSKLPPHQAQDLSAEQRRALPAVSWDSTAVELPQKASRTVWKFASPQDNGEWCLGPGQVSKMEGAHCIDFFPRQTPELAQRKTDAMRRFSVNQVEFYQVLDIATLGWVFDVDVGKAWVEQIRRQDAGWGASKALSEAGFKEKGSYFAKRIGFGYQLVMVVSPMGRRLFVQKGDGRLEQVLAVAHLCREWVDLGKPVKPLVWPAVVANPEAACVALMLQAATAFEERWQGPVALPAGA